MAKIRKLRKSGSSPIISLLLCQLWVPIVTTISTSLREFKVFNQPCSSMSIMLPSGEWWGALDESFTFLKNWKQRKRCGPCTNKLETVSLNWSDPLSSEDWLFIYLFIACALSLCLIARYKRYCLTMVECFLNNPASAGRGSLEGKFWRKCS